MSKHYQIKINFEFLVFFGLLSLFIIIFLANDHESKVLYARVVEALISGFLGYVTRGVVDKNNQSNQPDYSSENYPDYSSNYSSENYPDYSSENNAKIEYNELLERKQELINELNGIRSQLNKE